MSLGMRKAFGASAAGDAWESAEMTARLRQPVATCRQIAVMSVRGGAGKTTVAALTATVIAQYREDRVLAVDADSGLGSLPLRLGVRPERSVHDLAAVRLRTWEEAAGYLTQTSERAWVLSGTASGRIGAELDLETFRAAAGGLSRYFSAAVIDCGAGIVAALQQGILANAHGQILVAPGTVDGALSARGALDWYASNGFAAVLPRTVVALVTHSPHADADFQRAEQLLSAGGMTVINVPYDRHLAAGTAIDTTKIGAAARMAVTRIAAEAFVRSAAV
jgi:MinD-like ATPase involved in chromosome partitioning or flagellar assembly